MPHGSIEKTQEFEKGLSDNQQAVYPFVTFTGEIDSINRIYVVLKGETYNFTDITNAVEARHKYLVALNITPYLCDYVCQFLEKLILNRDTKKAHAPVLKFLTELRKRHSNF